MSIEMSKSKKFLFGMAMILCTIAVMGEMVMLPFVYNLYYDFPDQYGAVNYIASGASLIMIFSTILATLLLRKLSKKTILIIGSVVFAVSSIFCAAIPTPGFMVITRSFMGLGEGFVSVAAAALIAQVFIDEAKRATFMGIYNAGITFVGAAMTYASGWLAVTGWQNSFKAFWPSVLMVLAIIFFIPNIKVFTQEDQEKQTGKKERFGSMFWIFIFDYVLFTLMYASSAYYMSSWVMENGIGDQALSGTITAVGTIAGFIVCLLFGKIFMKLKKASTIPCFIMAGIALALMYFVQTALIGFISSILLGFAYGIYFSYSYTFVAGIVHYTRIDDAIGMTTTFYSATYFVVTFLATWLMGVMNTQGLFTPVFIVFACLGIVGLIVEISSQKKYKREFGGQETLQQ